MKFIINLILKLFYWIKSLFVSKENLLFSENDKLDIIGTAVFESQHYFFVRKKNSVFLVSDTKNHNYSQKISFSDNTQIHIKTMQDLDAITLPNGDHALVCTIKVNNRYKVVYFTSNNTRYFKPILYFENPNGQAHKITTNNKHEIFVLSTLDGKIHYKKIDPNYLYHDYETTELGPRDNSFDHGPLRVVAVTSIPDGIFILYEVSYEFPGYQTHKFGAALLAHDNLSHIHWRAFHDEIPFWENFISRTESDIDLKSIGAYFKRDDIKITFFDKKNKDIYFVNLHQPFNRRDPNNQKAILKKYVNNPILSPKENHSWESRNVFNPAAIEIDNVTHLLYRAEGSDGLSVIGYGKSYNGFIFDRLTDPIYVPRMDFEGVNFDTKFFKTMRRISFKSGYRHYPEGKNYDWHGVEDPRITEIDGRIYMIYAAFDGCHYARPAITSINKNDFLKQKWNWSTPQIMTKQVHNWGSGNKNVVLHPEKVKGKFLLFHRIWPHIRIDYVDDLEFGPGKQYLKELDQISARGDSWDSNRVGVSAPPLLIDEGWLLIYQGSGSQDKRYKVGAMILDKNNPSKILYRSNYPIMVPSEWYEGGISYVCGAVIKEGMLNIYYGGNDKYVCLAQAPLREFVDKLKQDPYQKPELQKYKNIKELCI